MEGKLHICIEKSLTMRVIVDGVYLLEMNRKNM